MKLSAFIQSNLEEILVEWDRFASTLLPSATGMSALALRDHAKQMLEELSEDIDTHQSPRQQAEKSKGREPAVPGEESAASTHGALRHMSGFTLIQLTAEFRALRATVLRLWMPRITGITETITTDMIRFNEAIDQALAESVVTYSEQADRTRDTFLGILGHDLRSPLATITMAGEYLSLPDSGTAKTQQIGGRVKRSAATMTSMVNDLLEYTRMQLGGGMPVTLRPADIQEVCEAALNDARAVHVDCIFDLETMGDLRGEFDASRMQQVLTNLLNNAAQYGDREHGVKLVARADSDSILITVKNHGPAIPVESLEAIFNPLVQLSGKGNHPGRPSTSLGLGLFIAREITEAHGGSVSAESDAISGTVFTLRIPLTAPSA